MNHSCLCNSLSHLGSEKNLNCTVPLQAIHNYRDSLQGCLLLRMQPAEKPTNNNTTER